MASASFTLSNHFFGTAFSAADVAPSSPSTSMNFRQQQPVRISASYTATSERSSTYHIGSQTSLYEVLGIHKGATCQEIKTAYRRLARVLHPDVASNNGREDISTAANDFMEVHKAYATLSDPEKRADYDRMLFRQRRPCPSVLSSSTTYSAGYTCRNWETDQCW